jgi:hypothetical protein
MILICILGRPLPAVNEANLQAGTGSNDVIVGAYYDQAVSQDFDAFDTVQFQSAVQKPPPLHRPGDDYRPGNATMVSVGVRDFAYPRLVPQLQLICFSDAF